MSHKTQEDVHRIRLRHLFEISSHALPFHSEAKHLITDSIGDVLLYFPNTLQIDLSNGALVMVKLSIILSFRLTDGDGQTEVITRSVISF